MAVSTTNPGGKRIMAMYAAEPPTATRAQLDAAYARGWISDADYAAATAPPPEPEPAPEPAPEAAPETGTDPSTV